jgi:hypothetical protein
MSHKRTDNVPVSRQGSIPARTRPNTARMPRETLSLDGSEDDLDSLPSNDSCPMSAESLPTNPAALQQLSNDVIQMYRDTAAFSKRAMAGEYGGAQGEAEQELNRLLRLAYEVLVKRDEFFFWFRRAHAHNALGGGWAIHFPSWHDRAACDAGRILWESIVTPAPPFPPNPGDPPPPLVELGTNWEYLEMEGPIDDSQFWTTPIDQNDGWEVNWVEGMLQSEAALAYQMCLSEEAAAGVGTPTYLGERRYQVGDEIIYLDGTQAILLECLVELQGTSLQKLKDTSGVPNPSNVLKAIRERHPKLAPFIKLPGGKGKGGYSTTIVDGRDKQ